MTKLDLYISKEAPSARNCAWLKPVNDGCALYVKYDGKWHSLKLVNDQSTSETKDDTVQNLIGSVQDKKTDNTINGAKAYAKAMKSAVVGTTGDTAQDMTLYGLKAYIEEQVAAIE